MRQALVIAGMIAVLAIMLIVHVVDSVSSIHEHGLPVTALGWCILVVSVIYLGISLREIVKDAERFKNPYLRMHFAGACAFLTFPVFFVVGISVSDSVPLYLLSLAVFLVSFYAFGKWAWRIQEQWARERDASHQAA